MPDPDHSPRLRRRKLFLQSWRDVLLRGLSSLLAFGCLFGVIAELWLNPSPPFALELLETRHASSSVTFADMDGDGLRDRLIAVEDSAYAASFITLYGTHDLRRGEAQTYFRGKQIIGRLSVLHDRHGHLLLVANTVEDSLARIGLALEDSTGQTVWHDILVTPITAEQRRRRIFPMAAQAVWTADSTRIVLPVFGNYQSWRGTIVVDPAHPSDPMMFPNGLGMQEMSGPIPAPNGRAWFACGRSAAGNRVLLGGFEDDHARVHGFDPDSGYTTCLDLIGFKDLTYASIPGNPRVLILVSGYEKGNQTVADCFIWNPVSDSLLWSGVLHAGRGQFQLMGESIWFLGEDGGLWTLAPNDSQPRQNARLPLQDTWTSRPVGGAWLSVTPAKHAKLFSHEGRQLASMPFDARVLSAALEEGHVLAPGSILLIHCLSTNDLYTVLRLRLLEIPLIERVMSNALSRWALAIASLVFLLLLARRLGTQETLLRQVLQPGNRAVGIFDGSLRLVYENSAFAEELSDPARVASLLSLADGSQPAPLRLEDGLRRMIWHRRLHVRSRGRKPWTILEGEDLSLERENEQQRLFLMKLAVMAHDLKAPLTPIRLQAEGIEDALPMLPPEVAGRVRHALGEIDRQVERSLQLITRFMGMARTEFELSPVSLPDIARAAMNELESMGWPELDTRLVYDSSVSHVAEAEGDVLQLALFELLLNAAQSMEGQVSLLLTLSSGHEGSTLRVEDNGPGIPEADLARVLEPGYTTRAKGTGFGLYFVKRVLERMGGGIEIHNRPEGGVAVRVNLQAPGKESR